MRITLKVWRQQGPRVTRSAGVLLPRGCVPGHVFPEMLDALNERLLQMARIRSLRPTIAAKGSAEHARS